MKNPLAILKKRVKSSTYAQVAQELGVSSTYIYDVLAGKRQPGPTLLKALGVERVITYRALPPDRRASTDR
ncbi:MAG: helix-turn-helix domain-containing protein [Steroidobacteraceae bacterium]